MAKDKGKKPGIGPKTSGAGGPKKEDKTSKGSVKATGTKISNANVPGNGGGQKAPATKTVAPPVKGDVKKKVGGKKKGAKKKGDVVQENLSSLADGMILSKIETKNNMDVKDLLSEELYNPAGKETVEYGDYKTFDFSQVKKEFSIDTNMTIEIDHDKNVKVVNMEKVTKVIDIDGHELTVEEENPEHKRKHLTRKKIDESKLEFEPLDQLKDYKANRNEYQVKCRVCQNTRRCQVCMGSGRRFIFFKCKNCSGTGKCPDCNKTYGVKCRHCKEDVISYSPRCLECGKEYTCPTCQSLLPISATRCIKCRTEFICRRCKLPVAPGMERRCPRCNAKVEQALY